MRAVKRVVVALALMITSSALAQTTVFGLLGHLLTDREGAEIGRIIDVLITSDGMPRAAVADIGGFLGIGSRRIAIPWGLLQFRATADGGGIAVNLPGDAVAASPEYHPGDAVPGIP